ncbi:hypothetical protein GDO81_030081 [Engystomops pustulosus]|nr:hypothetical protein GDO81_030081 [Engystomops pustulosus]
MTDGAPSWRDITPYMTDGAPTWWDTTPYMTDGAPSRRDITPYMTDGAPSRRDIKPYMTDGAPHGGTLHPAGPLNSEVFRFWSILISSLLVSSSAVSWGFVTVYPDKHKPLP